MSKTVYCNCKAGCKTKHCVCLKNNEACDDNCGCTNCMNPLNGIGVKITIPNDVKKEVVKIVDRFNKKQLKAYSSTYHPRFSDNFLCLDRADYGKPPSPICCLKYTGEMNNWEFAIFKYSLMCYDPDECWFPGEEYVDGTIEGALKAGMKAYHI